jgi:hypothetical protein
VRKGVALEALIVSALMFGAAQTGMASQEERNQTTRASAGGARITGIVMNHDSKQPLTNAVVRLYLRKGVPNEKGWAPVKETKFSAGLDSEGKFSVAGVKAGTYILMVEKDQTSPTASPQSSVARHEDGKTLTIEVTSKAQIDVGQAWIQFVRGGP